MRNIILSGFLLFLAGCASSSFHTFELGTNSRSNKLNLFDKYLVEIESPENGVNKGVRISDSFHIAKGKDLVWVLNEAYGAPRIGMTFADISIRINVIRNVNLSEIYESPVSKFIKLLEDERAKKYPEHPFKLQEKKFGNYIFAVRDDNMKEYQTVNSYFLILDDNHFIGIHFEYSGDEKDISEFRKIKQVEETIVSSLNIKAI